jgi:tryptophan 2,3-dioxygenase
MIRVRQRNPDDYEQLKRAACADLYDQVLGLLSRRGYGIPAELLERDFPRPTCPARR